MMISRYMLTFMLKMGLLGKASCTSKRTLYKAQCMFSVALHINMNDVFMKPSQQSQSHSKLLFYCSMQHLKKHINLVFLMLLECYLVPLYIKWPEL